MKYLRRYAEDEARNDDACQVMGNALRARATHAHVVVIPAMGETESLVTALQSVPRGPTLAIVVVNAREDSPQWVHDNNVRARRLLRESFGAPLLHASNMQLHAATFGTLLVVERGAAPHWLGHKQGVGRARKIGGDLALRFIEDDIVVGPWIHMTDADVQLPSDYFTQAAQAPADASALVHPFRHHARACPALGEAMQLYDIWLRYYVLGLRTAGSPYAFHTIGSTIAARASHYAAVRGMPLRDAAEDFYFLDKLRKVGPVHPLFGGPVQIDGRVSQRVPFGTGKALWRLTTDDGDTPFLLYDPRIFEAVRQARAVLHRGCAVDAPEYVYQLLDALGAGKACRLAADNTRTAEARARYIDTWFDAFRTLKFVHMTRDRVFPSLPWREALARASFVPIEWLHPDPAMVMRMMTVLDEETARATLEPIVRDETPMRMRFSAGSTVASYAARTGLASAP